MARYDDYRQWKSWGAAEFGVFSNADAIYYGKELSVAGFLALSGSRVLEIGFGNGGFAAWAKINGADYTGVEVIPDLVDQARKAGFRAFHASEVSSAAAPSATYNLIVAFDVFEHLSIEQLTQELLFLRTTMAPESRLLARLPSGDSPFARSIQHGDLTHVCTLGSSAIRQLASQLGFDVLQVREPAYPLRGSGVAAFVKRALIRVVRPIVFRFIRTVLMGNRDAVLTPNLVFVFARAQ